MKHILILAFLVTTLGSHFIFADETANHQQQSQDSIQMFVQEHGGNDDNGGDHGDRYRTRKFNLVCYYKMLGNYPFGDNCRAALSFLKLVTKDGGEVIDSDPDGLSTGSMSYNVVCDANPINSTPTPLDPIYNDGGLRFTDLLGTKIQGISGPTPTVFLNRGALHNGNHIAESYLELTHLNQKFVGKGQCSLWTEEAHD